MVVIRSLSLHKGLSQVECRLLVTRGLHDYECCVNVIHGEMEELIVDLECPVQRQW
jgi:hypothetical protein